MVNRDWAPKPAQSRAKARRTAGWVGHLNTYPLDATAVGALRSVDLTVRRGEFVALMGPSGCGKTTLLNVIGAIDLP